MSDEDELISKSFNFPPSIVRDLRDADEDFDAICRDFAALSNEMAITLARENQRMLRYVADAAGSISALADEISAKLVSVQNSEK